jgi:hypothetical protein
MVGCITSNTRSKEQMLENQKTLDELDKCQIKRTLKVKATDYSAIGKKHGP